MNRYIGCTLKCHFSIPSGMHIVALDISPRRFAVWRNKKTCITMCFRIFFPTCLWLYLTWSGLMIHIQSWYDVDCKLCCANEDDKSRDHCTGWESWGTYQLWLVCTLKDILTFECNVWLLCANFFQVLCHDFVGFLPILNIIENFVFARPYRNGSVALIFIVYLIWTVMNCFTFNYKTLTKIDLCNI